MKKFVLSLMLVMCVCVTQVQAQLPPGGGTTGDPSAPFGSSEDAYAVVAQVEGAEVQNIGPIGEWDATQEWIFAGWDAFDEAKADMAANEQIIRIDVVDPEIVPGPTLGLVMKAEVWFWIDTKNLVNPVTPANDPFKVDISQIKPLSAVRSSTNSIADAIVNSTAAVRVKKANWVFQSKWRIGMRCDNNAPTRTTNFFQAANGVFWAESEIDLNTEWDLLKYWSNPE